MIYNLQNKQEVYKFNTKVDYSLLSGKVVELKEIKVTRSTLQNSALHKYFTFISDELNELGMEFNYFGVKGMQLSMRYTPTLVKDFFFRPIMISLFDIESTTKINTNQLNEIIDIITKFFADKGVVLLFPSIENLNK